MKRTWRRLRHQTRVALISMASALLVLGFVLFMTAFLLRKSSTDTVHRDLANFADAFARRSANRELSDIVDRMQRREPNAGRPQSPPNRPGSRRAPAQVAGADRRGTMVGGAAGAAATPRRDPGRATFALYDSAGERIPGAVAGRELTDAELQRLLPEKLADFNPPPTYLSLIRQDAQKRFTLVVVYDFQERYAELGKVDLALFILWPALVAALTLATYFAVGSSFQPLQRLLVQAKSLNLDDRLEPGDQAEFGMLAASINSYLDRIQAVVRQQEEFATDAAHELRTPLTALRGQLELALLKTREPQAYAEAAGGAIAQVSRLERLIESLLLATRPRGGPVERCDVDQAVQEVHARWVDRYADHDVHLELAAQRFSAAMPEEEIESVLDNLLANALKFSPPGSTVHIALDADGMLAVEDQGAGIPEADRQRIFERFERGTTRARGFGIGLYLARRLLEQRGGSIKVGDSNSGARLEVLLPA